MDDFIYTLLFVGWIVYSIYSAVKKNKAKVNSSQSPSSPTSESSDIIDNVLESMFHQEKPSTASVAPHPYSEGDFEEEILDTYQNQEEVSDYEEADYLDTVPEADVESKIDTYSGTDNVEPSIILEEEENEIQKSAIDDNEEDKNTNSLDFDLRQAVIAQAILERPYE
ncbi:MAG: hypothetical protein DRI74_02395 [Bacteroidetes bacterium]|nr:MAG: hypothetical protein DRI74_02395 [Bacteroidota bacterium]